MKKRARCHQRTLFLHFYRGYEKCFFNYEKLLLLSVVLLSFLANNLRSAG